MPERARERLELSENWEKRMRSRCIWWNCFWRFFFSWRRQFSGNFEKCVDVRYRVKTLTKLKQLTWHMLRRALEIDNLTDTMSNSWRYQSRDTDTGDGKITYLNIYTKFFVFREHLFENHISCIDFFFLIYFLIIFFFHKSVRNLIYFMKTSHISAAFCDFFCY